MVIDSGLRLAELAFVLQPVPGRKLLLVETLGVGLVNPGAGDAVEGGQDAPRTAEGAGPFASMMVTRA
jgi:hypothetical protein